MNLTEDLISPLGIIPNTPGQALIQPAGVPFPVQKQLMSNWCWAASTVSLCKYYNDPPITQRELVAEVLKKPMCASGNYPSCNQAVDFSYALEYMKHLKSVFEKPLSEMELLSTLERNGPVGCQISIPDWGGHAVVVVSIKKDTSSKYFIQVADPSDGTLPIMPFTEFRNNFRGMRGRWIRTYITV